MKLSLSNFSLYATSRVWIWKAASGAGTSTKVVLPSRDGDLYHKRVERCDNGKSIPDYLDHIDKFIERKKSLFALFKD